MCGVRVAVCEMEAGYRASLACSTGLTSPTNGFRNLCVRPLMILRLPKFNLAIMSHANTVPTQHFDSAMAAASDSKFGPVVPDIPATPPSYDIKLTGRLVTIVPIDVSHAPDLYSLVEGKNNKSLFDYLFDEHPESFESFQSLLEKKALTTNPWTYAILLNDKSRKQARPVGYASLWRMDLSNRVLEVGSILYTPALQRTPAATEAMYLLARYVFEDLGFRRYEWKCNSLNEPSRRAAARLGFVYEGTFRQHMIARGHNRDTSWFSMIDADWPAVKKGFEAWLDDTNFDGDGKQKRKLEDLRPPQ